MKVLRRRVRRYIWRGIRSSCGRNAWDVRIEKVKVESQFSLGRVMETLQQLMIH